MRKQIKQATFNRLPLTIAVLACMQAGAVFAQETPTETTTTETNLRATDLDKVTVTGSRIARAGFDTLEPASVVSRQALETFGYTNIADAMFDVPSFSGPESYAGDQTAFGAGVNFLSRFGLGSNRLLTLVNGRRFVTSNPPTVFGPGGAGGVQVDLNAIPSIMIDRVETIGVGGAPTYGSDAISGVSNYILRKDFEGAEVELGYGQTSKGDNERKNWSGIFGTNFAQDRGNITVAVELNDNDGVLSLDRDFYRQGYSLRVNPLQRNINLYQAGRNPATDGRLDPSIPFNTGNGDGIFNNVFIRNRRINNMTFGGLVVPPGIMTEDFWYRDPSGNPNGFGPNNSLVYFDKSGNLLPFNVGTTFGTSDSSGGDGLNLNETSQILSTLKRKSVYANGRFDFTDNVTGFFEASWFNSRAQELADQNVYNASSFGASQLDGSGDQSGNLPFNINNPFLTDQARAVLQGLGVTDFRLSRSSRDLSMNNSSSESRISRYVAGVNGYFQFGDRNFNWEASVTHGRGDFDYYNTGIIQQNFINAINVTRAANGQIICDATAPGTTADPNCRPLNLFGEGVATPDALAYVATPDNSSATMRQTVYNANISGGLFDLPGGEFGFNVGFEHRNEEGSFTPSRYGQLGLGRSVAMEPTKGDFSTNEYFAEVLAPLVNPDAGIPGLSRLDLTAKIRRVENSVNGWFTAYTYGLQYEPFAGVQLRGNRTESFRAPSISELYTRSQSAYFFIPEYCTPSNIDGGKKPAVRRRNCEAFFASYPGVDPATFQAGDTSKLGTLNGSSTLGNEKAKSWTAGIVLTPDWLKGLRVAADWYEIDITNAITDLSPDDIVSGCFDNDDFNAGNIPSANRFCSLITRDQLGVASGIATEYGNGPITTFRGWTGEVNYRFDMHDYGRVDLGFYGYFPKELSSAAAADIPLTDTVGTTVSPKRQLQWSGRYSLGDWNLGVQANYTSSALVSLTAIADARQYPKADSYTIWNASIGYNLSENARLNLAVLNVADEIGPFPFVYDALGRRYMMTLKYNFR